MVNSKVCGFSAVQIDLSRSENEIGKNQFSGPVSKNRPEFENANESKLAKDSWLAKMLL